MPFELSPEQIELADVVRRGAERLGSPRTSLDDGPALDSDFWKQLAQSGLIGLRLIEELGGADATLMDEVMVAEQLGAAVAAVPVLTTSAAATALNAVGALGVELAAELVSGVKVVGLAISAERGTESSLLATEVAGEWRLSGTVNDLLEGASLDIVLVLARAGDRDVLVAVDGAHVVDQPSLDPTQRLGSLTATDVDVRFVGDLDDAASLRHRIRQDTVVLMTAQALGAADRALAMTVDYVKERTAFGQPIGRFQAIKHPLAESLILVENARSATYNAGWAIDEQREDADLAVSMAKAVGTENAVKVVHGAIQAHGGIGFTWEYDLHLLLRRAKSAELALGEPGKYFEMIAARMLDGGEVARVRPVSSSSASADADFGAEFEAWLDKNLPDGWGTKDFAMPRGAGRLSFLRSWQATMAEGRWVGIHWPTEFGGRNATLPQQLIFNSILSERRLPPLPGHRGLTIVGPTLIQHGTEEQRARFLERIRRGDDLWAGGFSEPGAGSDLAALRTRAVIDGDTVVINGQKIWTSSAHWSNWIYTLVRTDPTAPKHEGISVVAIPLDAPGVSVRPIRQINGKADFNEVFFEDVRVPAENIIGPVNAGWSVNRTTLSHEHFTLFIGSQARYARSLHDIMTLARSVEDPVSGRCRSDEPQLRERLARAWATSQLIAINGMRNVAKVQAGSPPGPEGSIAKLFGQESEKHLFELAMDICGPRGLLDRGAEGAIGKGKWQFGYLGARAATIGGGTSEIHKNKIGEGVLGLPRDLWADPS